MKKAKQIEEMAKVIKSSLDGLGYGNFNFTADEIGTMFAEALYNAGYRKQSEGEWVEHRETRPYVEVFYICSMCGRKEYQKEPYCHCGAKMKGEKQ